MQTTCNTNWNDGPGKSLRLLAFAGRTLSPGRRSKQFFLLQLLLLLSPVELNPLRGCPMSTDLDL
jgi:hypothetical protein